MGQDDYTLMVHLPNGYCNYCSVLLNGEIPIYAHANELTPSQKEQLTARIKKELSLKFDKAAFEESPRKLDEMTQTVINGLISVAKKVPGILITSDDHGNITRVRLHQSLVEAEKKARAVIEGEDNHAPFAVELAKGKGLQFIITQDQYCGAIMPEWMPNRNVEGRTLAPTCRLGEEPSWSITYIASNGPFDSAAKNGRLPSRLRLIAHLTHEIMHCKGLDSIFLDGATVSNDMAERVIKSDTDMIQAAKREMESAVQNLGTDSFTTLCTKIEFEHKYAPLLRYILEDFDKKTYGDIHLSASELQAAIAQRKIPESLPEGVREKDYKEAMQLVINRMCEIVELYDRSVKYFPENRYPDRKAVLREYPAIIASLAACTTPEVARSLLPNMYPIIQQGVLQRTGYNMDTYESVDNFKGLSRTTA